LELGISQSSVTQLLNSEELVVPTDCGYSQDFIDLIKAILKRDPTERPMFEAILDNSWFPAVRDIEAADIEEFERQNAEAEEEEGQGSS
jgi:hypothetical protein